MPTRRRLPAEDRRAQLLDRAAELFASRPYEAVLMEDVAEAAHVSRALLYQHFATKRDLFAAIYRRAADRLLVASELNPGASLFEQVNAGIDAHIDYFLANSHTVLAANRHLAGDPVVQAIISDELEVLRHRMLDASGLEGGARVVMSALLISWLVFVRVLCVDWLETQAFSREILRDLCTGALLGALDAVPGR